MSTLSAPMGPTHSLVVTGSAVAGVMLACGIATGAVAVPDVVGTLEAETRSLGGWVYVAVAALVFLETTALLGFVIHGKLALLLSGVAAERGDASSSRR